MLSVTPGHSAGYLTNQVGAGMESYYTNAVGAGEPPGTWHGKGAELLGLTGEVDADEMSAIYERYLDPTDPVFADPDTRYGARTLGLPPKEYRTPDQIVAERIGEYTSEYASTPQPEQVRAWTLEAEKRVSAAAHFYDLTFSPDKSVTVLWTAFTRAAAEATAAGDEQAAAGWAWAADQVEDAVMEASARGLDYVERTAALTRTGRHGARSVTGRWADTQGITVARFPQHTSRENDPQIHVHQAVFSKVRTHDGRWLALDGQVVHAARPAAGAISERALELALTQRLGVQWEMRADGVGRRIVGIDPKLEDLFSARSRAIGPEAERRMDQFEAMYGRAPNAIERRTILQAVTLASRPGKTSVSESPEEMNERWHAEAAGTVAGGLGAQARRFRDVLDRANAAAEDATTARGAADDVAADDVAQPRGTITRDTTAGTSFSVQSVLTEALEACHGPDGRSTFSRHDLIRQINLALPDDLGPLAPDRVDELLEELADTALQSADVVQVAGLEVGRVPDAARLADGTADTVNPARISYATRGHMSAEWAVLRSAGERGRTALPKHLVEDWLTRQPAGQALSVAQREALLGLATSDAATSVQVGPAGTGKSFTAAAFDAAWRDITAQLAGHRNPDVRSRYGPGRAVGVAITQAAADVLAEDGVTDSANIAAFLAAQNRLTSGRGIAGDERWRLAVNDVLLVDEASMADTTALNRLQAAADAAGARVVLMGDPHQLGPVGAGGMMRAAIDRDAETYTLTEVRRFTQDWEATASLRLRDGFEDAVTEYDAHGRLIDAGRERDAVAAIARAAAADHLAGKDTVVITSSNEHAAQVAAQVRRHLADAGVVGPDTVQLDRDGTTAGVGDLVQARRIDRDLGLVNREVYRIDAVADDGTLQATSTRTGITYTVPPEYAAADLSLAYASTAHGAQGRTVDVGHLLLTPTSDRAGAYVGLTRGRESNTAWAVTDTGIVNPGAPGGTTTHTARGLLARALATESTADGTPALDLRARADAAAVDIAADDERLRRDAGTLLGLIEDETRIACRARLDTHLDQLATDGILTGTERARFGAEQGTEHLARLLRAHEQAGHDPYRLLREGIGAGDFTDALALSQVVAARIDKRHPLDAPTNWTTPTSAALWFAAGMASRQEAAATDASADAHPNERAASPGDDRVRYLDQVRQLYGDRQRELGEALAAQAEQDVDSLPGWVQATLGPLPAAVDVAIDRVASDAATDTTAGEDGRLPDAAAGADIPGPVDAYEPVSQTPRRSFRPLDEGLAESARTTSGGSEGLESLCATGSYVSTARMTRAEWVERAGVIAAQREAAGWTHPDIPLGRCPGVSTPEKRAAWHTAYTAAGMPEERRPEAEMTDGRLLVRARAAERARATAPPAVYEAQRERHRLADQAERDAVLARAAGRDEDTARHEADAARHTAAAQRLDEAAQTRARWLLHHAETLTAGDTARAELARRGITAGTETDRTTASDYVDWLDSEARARVEDDAHRAITEYDVTEADDSGWSTEGAQAEMRDDAETTAGPDTARTPQDRDVAQDGRAVELSAEAAEAEIAAAAAAARHAAAVLADRASQTEPALDDTQSTTAAADSDADLDDWEAQRARQIVAEQDVVATGVWRDDDLTDHRGDAGSGLGADDSRQADADAG